MQQDVAGEVGEVVQRRLFQKLGAGHRRDGLPQEAGDLQARIAPGAVADGEVHLAAGEVDQLQAGRQPHVDLRMGGLEASQARHQPLGGEGGGGRDGEAASVLGGGQQRRGLGQAVERFSQGGKRGLGRVGEQEALGGALEQRSPDIVLQVLDLLADGARRHRQFVGGAAEIHMPRGGLEGAQGVQGREPSALHSFPKGKTRTSGACEMAV